MEWEKKSFIEFIKQSPTPFHTVETLCSHFKSHQFIELEDHSVWELSLGKSYFLKKNGAMMAFRLPEKTLEKAIFHLSHTDSPCFKIKNQPQKPQSGLEVVGVEIYGAPLLYTWVNQTLHPAGVVFTKGSLKPEAHLSIFPDLSVMIPPLAIHLDREVNNKGVIFDKQSGLNPIFSFETPFRTALERKFKNEILGFDLFLIPSSPIELFGDHHPFIAGYRMDNLSSVYASALALINAKKSSNEMQVALFFDHEEIGSTTYEGAESKFFDDCLERICLKIFGNHESYYRLKANSLAISIDVAHGVHPYFPNKMDLEAAPYLGKGPVIKFAASKKYATTAKSASLLQMVKGKVQLQQFFPHGEVGCGSTVGPIFASKLGIETIDIGIPMLGMHAMKEIISEHDLESLYLLLKQTFEIKL